MYNYANPGHSLVKSAARFLCLIGLMMFFMVSSAKAQHSTSVTDGSTPLGLTPGAPAGSYALSGFDTVNPYNGNLNFALPLLQVGGRGGIQHTIPLVIEQHWRVMETPTHVFTPDYNVWTGIHLLYGPGVLTSRMVGVPSDNTCPDQVQYSLRSINRLTFTGSDGSETELRDVMSDGLAGENRYQQFSPGPGCSFVSTTQRGKVFVSSDGSAMTFISDSPISDFVGFDIVQWTDLNGYLLMRDGTRYRIDAQKVTWIEDRNGNRMTFQYGGGGILRITDSLNRVVTITYHDAYAPPDLHAQYDEITYYGFGHAARSIKLWYKLMQYCLRTTQSGDGTAPRTPRQLFPELGFGTDADNPVNPLKVSSVELPDGRTYQFFYNVYGELARVVLPTGGAYEYDIEGAIKNGNVSGVFGQGHQIYRRVVQKRTYIDGGAIWESKTTFSKPEDSAANNDGFVEVDQYSYPSTLLTMSKHYYTGKTTDSYSWNLLDPTHYSKWQEGKEFKTEVFDTDTTIKQRITHT